MILTNSASDPFPITEAKLVGSFLATLLFGFHTVAFGFCLRCLLPYGNPTNRLGAPEKTKMFWVMLWAGIIIWVLGVLDVALALYDNISGFVFHAGGPTEYFTLSHWVMDLRGWIFLVDALIGDFVMIHRCWIIWGRSWPIITFPIILFVAELGTGLASLIWQLVIPPNELLIHTGKVLTAVSLSNWAITCVLTVIVTTLIIVRIWSVERTTNRLLTGRESGESSLYYSNDNGRNAYGSNALRYAIRIVMESGLFYAATMFTLLMVYAAGSNGAYPMTDVVPQVVGISFNLIIVRAARHREKGYRGSTSSRLPSFAVRDPTRRREWSMTFAPTSDIITDVEVQREDGLIEAGKKPNSVLT
ncbi:hypothetical protein K435DRAFT_962888 [Dendrothele bispora CBS 962.96]|uniref:Uncharacterized protein n=1 Tax=Dendrothele bispora (strain CBS 962.96) TaxID=1314807 RepID=A0A4S8MIM5_DENBC|nr:hypothetical protein K435DRAFT_962888 [Dendrothele bispora CBS 962.96]